MSWFTEGFTRYYTDLILFRSGFISLGEYIDWARNFEVAICDLKEGRERYQFAT